MMIEKAVGPLNILQFEHISCVHGMTTRQGGVSTGGFESLNLGRYAGDSQEHIERNLEIFFKSTLTDRSRTISTHQTHSDHIAIIRDIEQFEIMEDTDALITNQKEVTLMTFYADCTPLFFHDQVKNVIAMAHSGWQGTIKRIGPKVVEMMQKTFGCSPIDIHVGIGPNISVKHYEVSKDFLNSFIEQDYFRRFLNIGEQKDYFDMTACIIDMLTKAGISKENIQSSGYCTYDDQKRFFSYRRQGVESGRMSAFIRLE